ncbi:hypothetical protein [Mycolicibacterium tusciae]|uniref:hypothetical protein n=1 Tax=Mycolicibacterium tusciae TaxID=75922 RepID=UPI00024A3AB2|nr:hypothetical protein [Mycolicibacterium tusciae]
MAKVNVNYSDLSRASGEYAELQAQAAALSPLAAEEAQRIIASHGPMGYPVAVGVVAGLARREARVQAKAAEFGQYSERFLEHEATYRDVDHAGAQGYRALDFSEGAQLPTPDDYESTDSFPKRVCWIGTADGDTSVCSEDTTEYLFVEDGEWKNRQVDSGFVAELLPSQTPKQTLLPEPPAPGSDPFANAAPRDVAVFWPNPDGTMGRAYRQPDGSVVSTHDGGPGLQLSPLRPGDLSMWGQLPI